MLLGCFCVSTGASWLGQYRRVLISNFPCTGRYMQGRGIWLPLIVTGIFTELTLSPSFPVVVETEGSRGSPVSIGTRLQLDDRVWFLAGAEKGPRPDWFWDPVSYPFGTGGSFPGTGWGWPLMETKTPWPCSQKLLLCRSLSQVNKVYFFIFCLSKIHFNIILQTPGSPMWFLRLLLMHRTHTLKASVFLNVKSWKCIAPRTST